MATYNNKKDGSSSKGKSTISGKPRELKGVTITAKAYKHVKDMPAPKKTYAKASTMASVQGKQVPQSSIDSATKANPALARVLGKPKMGTGGRPQYRDIQADLITSALHKKKK